MKYQDKREAEAKAAAINRAGLLGRMLGYMFAYVPMILIILFITIMAQPKVPAGTYDSFDYAVQFTLIFGIPALPLLIWELRIRAWRKKHNLPANKNITRELMQMELDQQIDMQQKALKKAGVGQSVDKSDLGYWHDLLQKGAITAEEYEVKKKELL